MTELAGSVDLAAWQASDPDLMVGAAGALVRAYCGWHVYPSVTETVVVDGPGAYAFDFYLPTLHMTGLTSITETMSYYSATPTALDLTTGDVQWSASGRVYRYSQPWTYRLQGLSVAFTHGYETVPADLQAVVLSIASRGIASPSGVVRSQVGLVSETYSQAAFNVAGGVALLGFEKDILNLYKIPLAP